MICCILVSFLIACILSFFKVLCSRRNDVFLRLDFFLEAFLVIVKELAIDVIMSKYVSIKHSADYFT